MDVASGERKVQCRKDLFSIGTWNVRFMIQGKPGCGHTRDDKIEHRYLRNPQTKMEGMGDFNLEWEKQCWDTIAKMTE